jgi:hypothetical protein
MTSSDHFPPAIFEKIGFYVYLYIDPRDESIFYVGKGQGNRAFSHLKDKNESAKVQRIREIEEAGMKARIEILVHGLKDENAALKIEASIIDLLRPETLTNVVRGYESRYHGRMNVEQITGLYTQGEAKITEPTMLIRISRLYRHTMSPADLYEATRGYWRLGSERNNVRLAMAVYDGIIREVYEVETWFEAGKTFTNRTDDVSRSRGRWEFVGRIASEKIRKKYLYRSVAHHFENQNPIRYLNIG